ncbi:MAG: DUF2235 domain-containing protein [Nocardioides sp.]|nr:DUF2235 domain-containing protein [Nocardioides sp.]
MDRLLGGWLGCGVFSNVRAGYRFLALNYEPGDEIFLFGFSRGAYTARSIAGIIGTTGLLTRKSLVLGYLGEALERYKHRPAIPAGSAFKTSEAFRDACCHPETPIAFLGVFDTVGALGVPTVLHTDHQFHDVKLGTSVRVARQALAIDERRRSFAPCLWSVPDGSPETTVVTGPHDTASTVPRVKQVWFQGVHTDVGGGYAESGLSDTTLLWMTEQARECGLVFDRTMLDLFLDCGRPADPHNSMKAVFWVANAFERIRPRPDVMKDTFVAGRRNLTPIPVPDRTEPGQEPVATSIPVMLASTARTVFGAGNGYHPRNLTAYVETHSPPVLERDEEDVVGLPRICEPDEEVVAAAPETALA